MIEALRARASRGLLIPAVGGLVLGAFASLRPGLALAAVGGATLVVLCVMQPSVSVALMFVGMLLDKAGVTGMKLDDFPVTLSKLTVLAGLGTWGLHVALSSARAIRWHPVQWGMVAMVGASAATLAHANGYTTGKFDLLGITMMLVMVTLVHSALAERDLVPLFRFCGLVMVLAMAQALRAPMGVGEARRASGTMGDANEWATMVLLVAPSVLGVLAQETHILGTAVRLASLVLAPAAILRSESRTALVVGIAILPACLFLFRHRKGELAATGALGAVGLPLVLDLEAATLRFRRLLDSLGGATLVEDSSIWERQELFLQGKQLFYDHWLWGVGPGNFGRATGFLSTEGNFRPAHNTWLQIASEQGVIGLGVTLLFAWLVARSLWSGWREARTVEAGDRVFGLATGLAAVGLMAATLGLLTFAMAWLFLGIALAALHQAHAAPASEPDHAR